MLKNKGFAMTTNRWVKARVMLGNTITVLFSAVALLLAIFLLQSRLTGTEPSIAGYRFFYIRSGSMEPAVKMGSLVVVQPLEAEDVRQGDVITYRSENGGSLTTHRVDHLTSGGEGLPFFYTRGDANTIPDPQPVQPRQLVGRVALTVPYLGYLLGYIHTREGLAILFGLAVLIVVSGLIRSCLTGKQKCSPADDGEVRAK